MEKFAWTSGKVPMQISQGPVYPDLWLLLGFPGLTCDSFSFQRSRFAISRGSAFFLLAWGRKVCKYQENKELSTVVEVARPWVWCQTEASPEPGVCRNHVSTAAFSQWYLSWRWIIYTNNSDTLKGCNLSGVWHWQVTKLQAPAFQCL